jgi:hypothetical protein
VSRATNEDSAVQRARWLAELAEALIEAQQLAERLATRGITVPPDLVARIESARCEVDALQKRRLSRTAGDGFNPKWSENLPWRRFA